MQQKLAIEIYRQRLSADKNCMMHRSIEHHICNATEHNNFQFLYIYYSKVSKV